MATDAAGTTDTETLSTGETVSLPLRTEAEMVGATFAVPREGVADLLPDGLHPIRATPRSAAMTVLSVSYDRIGDGQIDPYEELAVLFPAVRAGERSVPGASLATRGTGGYVWFLPVTTAPATALGVDIWGFPKVVADIEHVEGGGRRRTTVNVDGDLFLELSVAAPPSVPRTETGVQYTRMDGETLAVETTIDGRIGAWPLSDAVRLEFGDHPRAVPLRALDPGGRALARVSVSGTVAFARGRPL